MSQPLIANTYQILEQIGSGGGGIVYLGYHTRLQKKVVLKADKRPTTAKQDSLRREVDALKKLTHSYIPQVYDFLEENGTIYTVMDYIDGESFDKPLKRGEHYSQANIIEWATQLLEALDCLHNCPPHGILHADIKPANIMLTSQGDIRLIDFNIALALGDNGAIAVGRSFGYASPEHYSADFRSSGSTAYHDPVQKKQEISPNNVSTEIDTNATELDSPTEVDTNATQRDSATEVDSNVTELETTPEVSSPSSGSVSTNPIYLDVRSDIYSLGATLYHMMTGNRPPKEAESVPPITGTQFSPAVVAIISKAMSPKAENRYQSADEMRAAFLQLRDNDPRVLALRSRVKMTTIGLSIAFLLSGVTAFTGQRLLTQEQETIAIAESARALEEEAKAREQWAYTQAELARTALFEGNTPLALLLVSEVVADETLASIPTIQAVLTDALQVYDLSSGYKTHRTITLPSAPITLEISPSGDTAVALYGQNFALIDCESGEILETLPSKPSALCEVVYLDDDTFFYAGVEGVTAHSISKGTLWVGEEATSLALSQDGTRLATLYRDDKFANLYDTTTGEHIQTLDFGGLSQWVPTNDILSNPDTNLFAINPDGTKLALNFSDGSFFIYDATSSSLDIQLLEDSSSYTEFHGGFYEEFFALAACGAGEALFAIIDAVNMSQTGGFTSSRPFYVETDLDGIYLQTENIFVKIHPITGNQTPLVTAYENITGIARSTDHILVTTATEYQFYDENAGRLYDAPKEGGSEFVALADRTAIIGSLDFSEIRILTYRESATPPIFTYDPTYPHTESRISADGATVMLYSYSDYRLYTIEGELIAEGEFPDAETMYDQQYDKAGGYLEVVYYDGRIDRYSAQDFSLLSSEMGEKPDTSMNMTYLTEDFRVEAPLHGDATVYDLATGEEIATLPQEGHITYITQVGDYVISEYMSLDDTRYGYLHNKEWDILATLPNLCDIQGETLLFDDTHGRVYQSKIYSLSELVELANF